MLEHLFILYVHFGKKRSPLYNVPKQVHNLTWIWIHCGEKSLLMGNQFVVRQEDSNTHLTWRTRGKTIALCMDKVTPLVFKRQFLMINIVRVLVSCTFWTKTFLTLSTSISLFSCGDLKLSSIGTSTTAIFYLHNLLFVNFICYDYNWNTADMALNNNTGISINIFLFELFVLCY